MSAGRCSAGQSGRFDGGTRLVAVKLRLVRMGKKKQPTYRVVAADSRSPRDGRFLEVVGTYAPRGRSTSDADAVVTIDHDKAIRWLRDGAQPTERVERLLRGAGTFDLLAGGAKAAPAPGEAEADAPASPAAEAPAGTDGAGEGESSGGEPGSEQ
jgi:small subunit ribosomal protein S16